MTLIRRMAALDRQAKDPTFTNALGWLRLNEELTDNQVAAGIKFGELVGQYDRVQGFRRSVSAASYERGHGIAIQAIPEDPETAARVKNRYEAALVALPAQARSVVFSVCLNDDLPSGPEKRLLNLGLAALAVHFRMV